MSSAVGAIVPGMSPIDSGYRMANGLHRDAIAVSIIRRRSLVETLSWGEFDARSSELAVELVKAGACRQGLVALNSSDPLDIVLGTMASWKAGAIALPVRPQAPGGPLDCAYADLGVSGGTVVASTAAERKSSPTPDFSAEDGCFSALESGGTTGQPRLIFRRRPWAVPDEEGKFRVLSPGREKRAVSAGLSGFGFNATWSALVRGASVILFERFSPTGWIDAVADLQASSAWCVPTQMKWISESSKFANWQPGPLRLLFHGAGPCSERLKRTWIAKLGASAIYESYSSREDVMSTLISGDEWLAHPGSVGRVESNLVRIVDESGNRLVSGKTGRIYLRPHDGFPVTSAIPDASSFEVSDGFVWLGDVGHLDEDGYLYLEDREMERFSVGGYTVFPQQIEVNLLDCVGVHDAAVVGVEHGDLGRMLVAFVESAGWTESELTDWVRRNVPLGQRPLIRVVGRVPRDANGKVRRKELRAAEEAKGGG